MGLEKGCPCCKLYKDGLEFKKVMELEKAGLVIYRHTTPVNSVASVSQPEKAFHTKDNVFIIHNTKNRNVSTSNYMSEFEKAINCPRCKYIVKHTKELLLNVPFIRKKDVIGICDHCRLTKRNNERCNKCQIFVEQFLRKQEHSPTETRDSDEQEKAMLSKIKHILKDAPKAVYAKTKTSPRSETSLKNLSLSYTKSPTYHVPRVKDMFDIQKKPEKDKQQIKKGFLKLIEPTKLYSNKSDSEITFIAAKRRKEHDEPRKKILFNSTEDIAGPRYLRDSGELLKESVESFVGSAEFIGLDKHHRRLKQTLKQKPEAGLSPKQQQQQPPSTELEEHLKKEHDTVSPGDYGTKKWPSEASDIHEKEFIKNIKKYQHSYDDLQQSKYDQEVSKSTQKTEEDFFLRGIQKAEEEKLLRGIQKGEEEHFLRGIQKTEEDQFLRGIPKSEEEQFLRGIQKTEEENFLRGIHKKEEEDFFLKGIQKKEEENFLRGIHKKEEQKFLRGIQKESISDHKIRRHSSEETLLKSASETTGHKLHKDFSYFFIKETDDIKKPPRKRVSSSELIKDTQDMYRARAEEERLKKEQELKEKLEAEEKKRLAKIERKKFLDEERRLEELKRKKAEDEKRKLIKLKIKEEKDLHKEKPSKQDTESQEKSVKTSKEPSVKSKSIKVKPEKKESKIDKSLKSDKDSQKSKRDLNKQDKEELMRLEKERKLKEKSEKEEQMRKANELKQKQKEERDKEKRSKEEQMRIDKEEQMRIDKEEKQKQKEEKDKEKRSKEEQMRIDKEEQMRIDKEEKQKQKEEKDKEKRSKEEQMRLDKEEKQKQQEEKNKEKANKEEEMRKAKEEKQKEKEAKERQESQLRSDKEQNQREKEQRLKEKEDRQREKEENQRRKEQEEKDNEEKNKQKQLEQKLLADAQKEKEAKLKKKREEDENKKEAKLKLKSLKDANSEAEPERPQSKKLAEESKMKDLNINQIKIRKDSPDDLILQLVKLKQTQASLKERPTRMSQINIPPKVVCEHMGHKNARTDNCIICLDSDLELDIENIRLNETKPKEIHEVIVGHKIFKHKHSIVKKKEEKEVKPLFFSSTHTEGENVIKTEKKEVLESIPEQKEKKLPVVSGKYVEQEVPKGIIRYALSDRTFIEKGWTMLPTEKVVRKMNVYRMRPAHPEFDWFEHNKSRKLISYDTGEKLAEFDDNGKGRWFYRSGKVALDYYDAEEINAQQRIVIFSSGEPDERGCSRPFAILATFDYLGNGIVFDHAGKIRLKYNQTEGVVLDRSIGPVSHWKWHTLNDPPVLQQVMIDTQMAHKDPDILKLGGPHDDRPRPDNEEMLAIEFDNFIKEKSKKLSQKFKPFQIKMKALKINEYFSLKVLDQATIYLIYRDGSTNLKLNIGMILDHQEIVDTDTAEVGEVSNSLQRFPARTDSLAALQRSVALAQRVERARAERAQRLRPAQPSASVDRLAAGLARPRPPPPDHASCPCRRPAPIHLYYDTRLI